MRDSIRYSIHFTVLLGVIFLLAATNSGMVSAQFVQKPYFQAEANRVRENVCPHHGVELLYILSFRGSDYERDMIKQNKAPQPSYSHPGITITASQGEITNVKDLNVTYQGRPTYDSIFISWNDTFTFTPDSPGTARVDLVASYLGFIAKTSWNIRVWEDCKYTVEISADESGFRMANKQTVNQAQEEWSIIIYLKGLAKGVLADPLVNEGGEGGQKRPVAIQKSIQSLDDVTGNNEMFGDGIWLGKEEKMICGTGGPITCSSTFTVHPIPGEETIDFRITMNSGQCSGFTVWCKGPEGGGQTSIPPLKSLPFEMNAVIPREGGSSHYIQQLPYGVTMDYLISAYPEKEE
ncbi:MAG: hypothetical protein GYA15_10380 [Leptolinea sp.]|jgi:hypothetical protein|nr:hypothetical protein [Leptolinea sp.]